MRKRESEGWREREREKETERDEVTTKYRTEETNSTAYKASTF